MRNRFAAYLKIGREPILSDPSINAIRATIDARLVRELQQLNSKMVLLTICIEAARSSDCSARWSA